MGALGGAGAGAGGDPHLSQQALWGFTQQFAHRGAREGTGNPGSPISQSLSQLPIRTQLGWGAGGRKAGGMERVQVEGGGRGALAKCREGSEKGGAFCLRAEIDGPDRND